MLKPRPLYHTAHKGKRGVRVGVGATNPDPDPTLLNAVEERACSCV